MGRLCCFTLFLLTVRSENENFQGYHTEQIKGTSVTKDWLLKKEHTIGHSTEATPTENTFRHTTLEATAKFPGPIVSDTRPTPPYEKTQITKALAVVSLSREHLVSRNGKNSLTSTRDYPSVMRIHTGSEIPLISNHEKIAFSSTRAAFESMTNDISKPWVHLSTGAVKASLWLHYLIDNRNQRSADSISLTSANGGLGVPILSASHPLVIDNLAVQRNDKPSLFKTLPSIFQNVTAENSVRGNIVTNLCLTCLKGQRDVSTEKSVALPPLSPDGSSNHLSKDGPPSDFNQFPASLQSFQQQSVGQQEKILSKDSKTVSHSQSILNNSQIRSDFFDTGTAEFDTQSDAVISSESQKGTEKQPGPTSPSETFVTEGEISTTTALHRSSMSHYTVRNPVKNGKQGLEVSINDTHFSKNKNAHLTTTLKNAFIQKQHLDVSRGSVSNLLPEGGDRSAASHPTARMSLIEAHGAVTPFRLGRPNTSVVKNPDSLTGGTDSLNSVLSEPVKPPKSSHTKEPIPTLLPEDPSIKFASVTKVRHMTEKQDQDKTHNTVNSIIKHYSVDPSGTVNIPVTEKTHTVKPVKLFLSESRQDFDDNVSMLTLTTLSTKSVSESLTMGSLLGHQSKITFDVSDDNRAEPTSQSFVQYNGDLIRDSVIVHNLKMGDKNEQMLTAVTKDEDKENKAGSRKEEKIITTVIAKNQKNGGREEDKMKQHEAKTSRQEERGNITKDKESTAEKQREPLTKAGEEAGSKLTVNKEDIEQMTHVPFTPTNSKELNRDKGHTVTNLSSCHGLIKQLGATEHKGGKNSEIVEKKNMPFSYKVTSNHRPLHSTVRSESPKVSRMTSLLKESHTEIKPHPSNHRAMLTKHEATSPLTKESARNKVVETTSSVTAIPKMDLKPFKVSPSRFHGTVKPTIALHHSATKSAHLELNSISNMLSLITPRLAITAGLLRAQPHFTVNSSTLSLSIIYSISDHRHKFRTSVSEANSLLQSVNERQQAEHIIPAHIFESGVKDPLTSDMIEEVNTSVNPAPSQQMYNDSSTRPPTVAALSYEAHTSKGQLQPNQGQSTLEIIQSSTTSFDTISGQPHSFKLPENTEHSDALHALADYNVQGSVQTLMASMSPQAKNNQFPLSTMSPLLNLMLFGGDSLPGTYSLMELTRSASGKEMLRAISNTENTNNGSDHPSLLEISDGLNQTEENDSVQTMVTSAVKHSDEFTKQIADDRNEKNSSQTSGRNKHHANKTDGFNSLSLIQTENLAVKSTNENNQINMSSNDEGNSTVKTTQNIHHLSQLEDNKETNTITFTSETNHNIVQASNEHVVPVTSDFAIPVLDANDRTGTIAFFESDSQSEIPKIQTNDVTNNAITDMERHAAKATEKQHDPSTQRGSVSTLPVAHINIGNDLKVPNISTQQFSDRIMNISSKFQITTTKANDHVSLTPTASKSGPSVFSKAVPPAGISPAEVTNKSSCRTIGCARSGGTSKTTIGAGEIDHTAREKMHKTKAESGVDLFNAVQTPDTKADNGNCGTDCPAPGKTTPQATYVDNTMLSPVTSESDHATVDEIMTKNAKSMPDGPSTKTWRVLVETDHLVRRGTPEQAEFIEKTTQRNSHRETSNAQEAIATEVTLSEPVASTAQTTEKNTEHTLFTEKNTKMQLNRGAAKAEIYEAQNAKRSAHTVVRGETTVQESGRRMLLSEQEFESKLLRMKHRRRALSHQYLSGVTEVSEDLCGSGNYTAEMSLNLGRGVEPGDAVPALGNLRVVINLKTNNSRLNLEVTSCCLSPTIQLDLTSATCCLFSRLAAKPAGITLLPSVLSTSASFTIRLFQMINYSVVYLHCDLSVCLRNRSDCERQCLRQRSAFPLEGRETIATNLRNRISFGPMLKEVKNSTFPKEIDQSELDLVLVIVSVVVGSFLVTVMLLLVWVAYHCRAIWLFHLTVPPRACCSCLCRGGDLILP